MGIPRTIGFQLCLAAYVLGWGMINTAKYLVKSEATVELPLPLNLRFFIIVFVVFTLLEFVYAWIENPVPRKEA
jgi:hypothetical protein